MTTAAAPHPAKKSAVAYAEEDLGVHSVYEGARASRALLDQVLTSLSNYRDSKRELESRIQDQEMEIVADERGKHPDMSAAAMDKHLKVAFNNSDAVRELREQLAVVVGDIEGLEYDRSMHETDIRIAVSRMQELGGYLNFLAAVKQSANTAKPTTPGASE